MLPLKNSNPLSGMQNVKSLFLLCCKEKGQQEKFSTHLEKFLKKYANNGSISFENPH